MTKIVTIDGRKFVKGKATCLDCNKTIKFLLSVEIALVLSDYTLLCRACYWADMELDPTVSMTLRELVL
jgi:hypothetical protein